MGQETDRDPHLNKGEDGQFYCVFTEGHRTLRYGYLLPPGGLRDFNLCSLR